MKKLLQGCVLLFFTSTLVAKIALLPPELAISTSSVEATYAGLAVLKMGGNAFDAAVAISAVLAVTEPYSSGIGGGGFYLIHDAKTDQNSFIDAREKAPLAANKNMFLNDKGEVKKGSLSLNGPLAAAIPGEPAALIYLNQQYGLLPLAEDLQPAIHSALYGFKVNKLYREYAMLRLSVLRRYPASAKIFLYNNHVPELNTVIRQIDLAQTLQNIAKYGRSGFYAGKTAHQLVQGVRDYGGIWDNRDLQFYQVIVRPPLMGSYQGIKIITAPPPSAGGIALLTMLNILAHYPLAKLDQLQQLHFIIEAMRLAFWDRARYIGDPDFISVPVAKLISKEHAEQLRQFISPNKATPSRSLTPEVAIREGHDTTHFSVLDTEGNMVSATLSINYPFGSGFVVPKTGVLLNNSMDDFAVKENSPNVYGLVDYGNNLIAPRKRPVSSMTPTFLFGPQGVAILGTPGGSRIPTMVLLAVLNYVKGNKPAEWVNQKRYHMQYLPDEVQYEAQALAPQLMTGLAQMGYTLKQTHPYGSMQAILWNQKTNQVFAAADPRRDGLAVVRELPREAY